MSAKASPAQAPKPSARQILPHFAVLFLVSAALSLALMYGFFSWDQAYKQKILHKQAAGSMEIYGKVAEAALRDVATDLMFLVRDYRLSIFLRDNNSILREELAKRFLDVVAAKGRYDQIRVIAAQGMELIRVNYNNGQPEMVSPKN